MREASFSLPLLMNWWALAEEALVGLLMKGDYVCMCVCWRGDIHDGKFSMEVEFISMHVLSYFFQDRDIKALLPYPIHTLFFSFLACCFM